MFEKYFPLIKAVHVDLLPRRHQLLSNTGSDAAARMVSLTRITVEFRLLCKNNYLLSSVIGSAYKTSCDEL